MRMQLETARLAATPRPFIRSQRSVDPFAVAVAPHLLPLDLPVAFAIVSAAVTSLLLDYHRDILDKLVLLLLLRHICSRPACQMGYTRLNQHTWVAYMMHARLRSSAA